MNDDELIAALAGGDDAALRELFCRHAPWLAARLRAVLPAAEVEDVVQETFLAVWRGAAGYRPAREDGAAGGWLWGIARRQAALLLRRGGRAVPVPPAMFTGEARHPENPEETALARADLDHAVAALGAAGGPDREVWRLLYVEDRPVAEVARLMGIPDGTVKSRAHRVRRLLRTALRNGQAETGGAG
jgi:RNA polymerase sigma-70 factor, ECF subfamily